MNVDTPIDRIFKLPKPQLAALKKLGLVTIRDVLLYFPYRYLDFSQVKTISQLKAGEMVSVKGTIKSIHSRFSFRGRVSLAEALVSDNTGTIKIVWFNQPYLAKSLKAGEEIFVAGAPENYQGILQFVNPIYEKVSDLAYRQQGSPVHTARLLPVYHLTAKLYPKTLRNLIARTLPAASALTDDLPDSVLQNQKLPDLKTTVKMAHFPESTLDAEIAKKRLAFEEIFLNQLAAQQYKMQLLKKRAPVIKFNQPLIKQFVSSLPFKLTDEQRKAAWQILQDLEKPVPMNRLLEGDVGSGKTVVALIAALEAVSGGFQVALLAPTEILARQHFETSTKFLTSSKFNGRYILKIALLTNNYAQTANNDASKSDIQKAITDGTAGLYIGTHALLQEKIKFSRLALVIIDEQHRFGVEQRASLLESDDRAPHLLSLSATPIPRSLQLAFYGELDITQIKSKPSGRKPVITRLAPAEKRKAAYEFIRKQIQNGRQVFVVTPLVEESDKFGAKSAKKEVLALQKNFPEFKIGLLHGRMNAKEKERVMSEFLANKINILVSTAVVEVGVDVPNASVMIIEGAERFGLAQLHQFRGRVGRAGHQSYCFLFISSPLSGGEHSNEVIKRLQAFASTQDGFALAELDLKLRGFGDLYGSAQSGWNFKYFDPTYISLIEAGREEAKRLLSSDINLENYPALKAKIQNKTIHFE